MLTENVLLILFDPITFYFGYIERSNRATYLITVSAYPSIFKESLHFIRTPCKKYYQIGSVDWVRKISSVALPAFCFGSIVAVLTSH